MEIIFREKKFPLSTRSDIGGILTSEWTAIDNGDAVLLHNFSRSTLQLYALKSKFSNLPYCSYFSPF